MVCIEIIKVGRWDQGRGLVGGRTRLDGWCGVEFAKVSIASLHSFTNELTWLSTPPLRQNTHGSTLSCLMAPQRFHSVRIGEVLCARYWCAESANPMSAVPAWEVRDVSRLSLLLRRRRYTGPQERWLPPGVTTHAEHASQSLRARCPIITPTRRRVESLLFVSLSIAISSTTP
jgi:hypothetical protein